MPISQLPDATVWLLRSTLVLNDASTVIKELVDNALDAGATSIIIEVSANALDVLQVKDNGVGIDCEDRQLLCKRGCTSKIRTLDDLEKLGGSSLGFRGEALSSIAELSERVIITTHVRDEKVGTTMKFGSEGKMLSSASASHPVGTTIRIQNFLSKVPVRRQEALKNSKRIITGVNKLLVASALVRPMVRYSFKILKHEHDKANWSFVPSESPEELKMAAVQLFGNEIATCCKLHTVSFMNTPVESYTAKALLLEDNINLSKYAGVGQFIAIDGRPVAAERGTICELAKMYRKYLKYSLGHKLNIPSKPFLVLQITCPVGTYDVNVESAKNQLLFHQADAILALGEDLFSKAYGEILDDRSQTQEAEIVPRPSHSGFSLSLARKSTENEHIGRRKTERDTKTELMHSEATVDHDLNDNILLRLRQESELPHRMFPNMYGSDDDSEGSRNPMQEANTQSPYVDTLDEVDGRPESNMRNPFTTAAMHAKITPRILTDSDRGNNTPNSGQPMRPLPRDISNSPSHTLQDADELPRDATSGHYLPTPSKSPNHSLPYQNPGPPFPRFARRNHSDESSDDGDVDDPSLGPSIKQQQNLFRNWVQSGTGTQTTAKGYSDTLQNSMRDAVDPQSRSSMTVQMTGCSQPNHNLSTSQKLYKSPLKRSSNSLTDGRKSLSSRTGAESSSPARLSELEEIMEFEHRKRALNQRPKNFQTHLDAANLASVQRATMEASEIDVDLHATDAADAMQNHEEVEQSDTKSSISLQRSNPYKNRYEAALRSLKPRLENGLSTYPIDHSTSVLEEPGDVHQSSSSEVQGLPAVATSTPDQHTLSSSKNPLHVETQPISRERRAKRIRLPLEAIPPGWIKHDIQCIPDNTFPDTFLFQKSVKSLDKYDPYIKKGQIDSVVWSPFSRQTQVWEAVLEDMIKTKYKAGTADPSSPANTQLQSYVPNIKLNLVQAMKGHIAMLAEEQEANPATI